MLVYHCEDEGPYVTKLDLDEGTSENVIKEVKDLETINQSLQSASSITGKSADDERGLANLALWKEVVDLTSASEDADAVVKLGTKRVLKA